MGVEDYERLALLGHGLQHDLVVTAQLVVCEAQRGAAAAACGEHHIAIAAKPLRREHQRFYCAIEHQTNGGGGVTEWSLVACVGFVPSFPYFIPSFLPFDLLLTHLLGSSLPL